MGRAGRRGVEFLEHELARLFGQPRPESGPARKNAHQVLHVWGVARVVDDRRPDRLPGFNLIDPERLHHRACPGHRAFRANRQLAKVFVDLPSQPFDLAIVGTVVEMRHWFPAA